MPANMKSPSFLLRGFRRPREIAGFGLGKLERQVLEEIWRFEGEVSVRDVYRSFGERVAYTTLMTTLDRLHRKKMLDRIKHGRAFFYAARLTRQEFESSRAADALRVALSGDSTALTPLLSFFVQAVSDRDHDLLDELEALVKARRNEIEQQRP